MILTCNSCEKKFVVPDQAITAAGRTVQCGSCGNKWKQFPIKNEVRRVVSDKTVNIKKTSNVLKPSKIKKKKVKKTREINLYSPEYLAKKHGISLSDVKVDTKSNLTKKISFGFYNYLILFAVFVIAFSKGLHFFQEFIIKKIPLSEFYLNYFFESIKNVFEILKNLISSY
jgi:predicted Zn finger-like uncharacterized protein|tara:strand:- start:141 stop:653 length:513 start_codon:yes stop_codon:yes gene_type:complete